MDAFDALLWPAMADFAERFRALGADVVLGGDATSYPDLAAAAFYPEPAAPKKNGISRHFANSGTLAGSAAALSAPHRRFLFGDTLLFFIFLMDI